MVVKDAKKQFAFRLACKGVKEIYLAADEEEEQLEWLSRLQSASQRGVSLLNHVIITWLDIFLEVEFPILGAENPVKNNTGALPEGIYNVPRILQDEVVYDVPPLEPNEPNESIPIARGIYDVPRSILCKYYKNITCNMLNLSLIMSYFSFNSWKCSSVCGWCPRYGVSINR